MGMLQIFIKKTNKYPLKTSVHLQWEIRGGRSFSMPPRKEEACNEHQQI
nr:MAG TPA: hypothetical protein [Caudoviricetes sp.]